MKRLAVLLALALLLCASTASARGSLRGYQRSNVSSGFGSGGGWRGFLPTWLPGVGPWYDADQGFTIATGVSQLNDLSSVAHNVTQATGSKQPTRNASDAAYGGHATLSYAAASSQVLASASFNLAQPIEEIIVGQMSGTAVTDTFVDWKTGGPTTVYSAGAGTQIFMYAGANLGHAIANNATPAIYAAVFNSTTSALYRNSAQTTLAAGNAGVGAPTGGIALGAQSGTSAFLTGKIATVVVVNRVLDAWSLWMLMTYESNRYGLPLQ